MAVFFHGPTVNPGRLISVIIIVWLFLGPHKRKKNGPKVPTASYNETMRRCLRLGKETAVRHRSFSLFFNTSARREKSCARLEKRKKERRTTGSLPLTGSMKREDGSSTGNCFLSYRWALRQNISCIAFLGLYALKASPAGDKPEEKQAMLPRDVRAVSHIPFLLYDLGLQ